MNKSARVRSTSHERAPKLLDGTKTHPTTPLAVHSSCPTPSPINTPRNDAESSSVSTRNVSSRRLEKMPTNDELTFSPLLFESLKQVEKELKPRRHSLFVSNSASGTVEKKPKAADALTRSCTDTTAGSAQQEREFDVVAQRVLMPLEQRHLSDVASSRSSAFEAEPGIAPTTSTSPKSSMRRLQRLSIQIMLKTYTLIEYSNDPLGLCSWRTLVVPNDQIDDSMHEYLDRATRSDKIDPLRKCECGQVQCAHLQPDLLAKVIAVYITDASYLPATKEVKNAVEETLRKEREANPATTMGRGCLAKYAIGGPIQTDYKRTPCTFVYRFKIFY